MIRLPALAIDANSPAIILGQSGQLLTKLVTLRLRQIDPVPLGEYSQQENWHIGSRVEGDHSIATALPLSTASEADFSCSAGSGNFVTCLWPFRQRIHDM